MRNLYTMPPTQPNTRVCVDIVLYKFSSTTCFIEYMVLHEKKYFNVKAKVWMQLDFTC